MLSRTFQFNVVAVGLLSPLFSFAQQSTVTDGEAARPPSFEMKLFSEVKWQKLNPARGNASPQAGTIWGDQKSDGESGFLVKFVDGFSSPPHIHNITYRGIVLAGALHNDDPDAASMWMGVGSYWTQPAGEVHITSARGASIGYVEIQSGPYLVEPPEAAFDNGERPINVGSTNIVWLDASDTSWIEDEADTDWCNAPSMAFLWGSPKPNQVCGTLLKLPAGFAGVLVTQSARLQAIVIKGELDLALESKPQGESLNAGGYFGSKGPATHHFSCRDECIVYIRTKGRYTVFPR